MEQFKTNPISKLEQAVKHHCANRLTTLCASALTTVAVFGSLLLPVASVNAGDHIDAPVLAHDKAPDIGDAYAFLDPNDNSKVVLMMTVNPFLISGETINQAIFDRKVRYRFEIENTGDARPDLFVDVRFGDGVGRLQPQTAFITLPNDPNPGFNAHSFTAPVTIALQGDTAADPIVTTNSRTGASFFAGLSEDPFFLDNTAANRFIVSSILDPGNPDFSVFADRAGPDGIGRDTYAGLNILTLAVSVPVSMLQGGSDVIGINAVTQRRRMQMFPAADELRGERRQSGPWVTVDRFAVPLVNNGLIPAERKDEYNFSSTMDDANGRFEDDIVQSLQNLNTNDEFIDMILDTAVRNGDILRLDVTVPNTGAGGGNNPDGGFGNVGGRRLQDDVADGVFTLLNNGVPLTDFVDANEVPFRDEFPFVADPHLANPEGVDNPDDRTRQ